ATVFLRCHLAKDGASLSFYSSFLRVALRFARSFYLYPPESHRFLGDDLRHLLREEQPHSRKLSYATGFCEDTIEIAGTLRRKDRVCHPPQDARRYVGPLESGLDAGQRVRLQTEGVRVRQRLALRRLHQWRQIHLNRCV